MTAGEPLPGANPGDVYSDLRLETRLRDDGRLQVSAVDASGKVLYCDLVDPASQQSRTRFRNGLQKKIPAVSDEQLDGLDHDLLQKTSREKAPQQECSSEIPGDLSLELKDHSLENIAKLLEAGARHVDARLQKKLDNIGETGRHAAVQLGRDSLLLPRIVNCIESLGHVGERRNCALLALCYTSSRLDKPLHALVVGESSSGKSHLCDKTSRIIPPELTRTLTEMTPKFLGYLSPFEVAGKVIVMGERHLGDEEVVAEKNKFRREMISLHYVIHGTVESDEHGRHSSRARIVLGPIASSETTTKTSVYPEDQNRMIVIEVDLSEEQTMTILRRQAAEADGTAVAPDPEQLRDIHNCIRLLKRPAKILIPFADLVTAQMPTSNLEVRRIQQQFFNLVAVCAFLHQMQRKAVDTDGAEVAWGQRGQVDHTLVADPRDYEIVANLMNPSLRRALQQKLSESDKRVLCQLQSWVANRKATPTPSEFLTNEAIQGLRAAGGKPADSANFRKQLRRLQDHGAVELIEQGREGRSSRWRLVLLDGSPRERGCGLPPDYVQLCAAYEAKAGRPVASELSPQAFQDEEWFCELGAAAQEWGESDGLEDGSSEGPTRVPG